MSDHVLACVADCWDLVCLWQRRLSCAGFVPDYVLLCRWVAGYFYITCSCQRRAVLLGIFFPLRDLGVTLYFPFCSTIQSLPFSDSWSCHCLSFLASVSGVLDCQFHPTQPWIFTAGADHQIRLYTWQYSFSYLSIWLQSTSGRGQRRNLTRINPAVMIIEPMSARYNTGAAFDFRRLRISRTRDFRWKGCKLTCRILMATVSRAIFEELDWTIIFLNRFTKICRKQKSFFRICGKL